MKTVRVSVLSGFDKLNHRAGPLFRSFQGGISKWLYHFDKIKTVRVSVLSGFDKLNHSAGPLFRSFQGGIFSDS